MNATPFLLVLLAMHLGFSHPAAVASGNGGAYNGPNLSGEAIPTSQDRPLTFKKVHQATQKCLTRLARDLWEQAYRSKMRDRLPDIWDDTPSRSNTLPSIEQFVLNEQSCEYSGILSTRPDARIGDRIEIRGNRCETGAAHVGIQLAKPGTAEWSIEWFEIQDGLPFFSFSATNKDGAYDEFGRMRDASRIAVNNLRLNARAQEGPTAQLINAQTLQPSLLRVNTLAYRQCLVSEVQK